MRTEARNLRASVCVRACVRIRAHVLADRGRMRARWVHRRRRVAWERVLNFHPLFNRRLRSRLH